MRKLKLFFTCLLMASISLVNAQTKTASGTVISSEDGLAVIGASVMVKGTSQGTVTDASGCIRSRYLHQLIHLSFRW